MNYVIVILASYLLGCSNMAFYLAKQKQVDARGSGSGNLGASNAMVLMGWKAGILTGIHDIGKAFLAVLLARLIFPDTAHIGAVAGVSCVLGHIFPVFLKFRGGKGFASYLGMTLALNWKLALVVMVLVVVITILTDYIVSGTLMTIISVPAYMGISSGSLILTFILLVATAVIFFKHWENYGRILNGTEIGLRSAMSGKHRAN